MGISRNIPNRLRKYRLISGYKQHEVAKLLKLRHTNPITRWEKGQSMPSLKNVLKLSILYNTFVQELYYDLFKEIKKEIKNN